MFSMTRSILLSRGLFGLVALVLGASSTRAAEPPPDILNGERQVLQVDDIVVAQTFKGAYDSYASRYVSLGLTSDKAVSQLLGRKLYSNRLVSFGAGGTRMPELIATGRLFNSSLDVAVTFTRSDYSGGQHLETTLLTTSGTGIWESGAALVPMTAAPEPRAVAVADFTGDGFADVVFHAGTPGVDSRMIIGTAADTNGSTWRLRFGPEYVGTRGGCLDMKAADLDGDGRPEIVCVVQDSFFLYVQILTVDPTTLEIRDTANNLYPVGSRDGGKVRLAIGKFDDNMSNAEIAVVHGSGTCNGANNAICAIWVKPIKVAIGPTGVVFTAAPTVDIAPSMDVTAGLGWNELVGLEVATGRLNWFGGNARDQLVVGAGMYSDSHYKGYAAAVVNFETVVDTTTNSTNTMSIDTAQVKASAYNNAAAPMTCLAGVAVGRFNPPLAKSKSETPINAQVALLLGVVSSGDSPPTDCGPDAWDTVQYTAMSVAIYTVDPANSYKVTLGSSTALPTGGNEYRGVTFAPPRMAVGDFQGHSLLLGQPTIISVAQQIQPQIVLGAPPMHLDYFKPIFGGARPECYAESARAAGEEPTSGGSSDWKPQEKALGCIQNVSAYPGNNTISRGGDTITIACDYCAMFATSQDVDMSGVQETTTSHTWSNEVGGSASITFGNLKPRAWEMGGVQFEVHGGAKFVDGNSNSTRNAVSAHETLKLAAATGADDLVHYSSQDVYYYLYPVIGQKDDQGNPIYLHFSVPDQTAVHTLNAAMLPWYQPAHEIGNIFSYPGNGAQLLSDHPGADQRSGTTSWGSQVQNTFGVTWTAGDSTEKTAGSIDRTDWNVGQSISGALRLGGVVIKGNEHYDHNKSDGHSYTNTNRKGFVASKGFNVTTSAFYKVDRSAYEVYARILGVATQTLDDGYWDADVPMPDPKGGPGENFVPAHRLDGPLKLAYTTNMVRSGSVAIGSLWNDIYGVHPDIALQHPRRFTWLKRENSVQLSDLWKFNPLPANVDLTTVHAADFLVMKGFFINPATAAPGQGPQLTMATEGTQLRLAARVFNNSLVGLPAGATVKVRFYAHRLASDLVGYYDLWSPDADACTVIGEQSVPIGGFRSDAGAAVATNRAMAETTFDTAGRGGQYLIFWVVAWAENADGTLVRELDQHGLTSKPPAGCSANSILDVPMEFYSNNVGFYDQPFYIKPAALAAAPRRAAVAVRPFSMGALTVSSIDPQRPYAGEQWQLTAPLQAGGEDALSVYLVHAGSGPGGSVSLTAMVPFIEAGQTYVDRVPFRPLWCGPHTANVTARAAFHDAVSAPLAFDIPCRPQDVTAFLNDVITDGSLAGIIPVNKNGQVLGKLAAIQTAVLTAEKLASKGGNTGACQQYAQALTRVSDAGNGPIAQLLEAIIRNARGQLGCR